MCVCICMCSMCSMFVGLNMYGCIHTLLFVCLLAADLLLGPAGSEIEVCVYICICMDV